MNVERLSQVLSNVQRLGSQEDILTGILAAMFAASRTFSSAFYQRVMKDSGRDPRLYPLAFPQHPGVWVAEKVSKKRYEWIEDKRIAFAPDIWILDGSAEAWQECKPRPEPSFHFLLECKEGAALTKGQMRGYPFFEFDLFGKHNFRAFTLLLYGHATDEEKSLFAHSLNWIQAGIVLEQCLSAISSAGEAEELRFYLQLYHSQLVGDSGPLLDAALYSDDAAARRICEWIRLRVPCDGTIEPRTVQTVVGTKIFKGKWLALNIDQKMQLWIYVERREGAFHLQLERWAEGKLAARPRKLILPPATDPEGVNDLIGEILQEQEAFAEDL